MNTALTSGYTAPLSIRCQTKLSEATNQRANRRIAQSLREDVSFMQELKKLGIYDDDAADLVEDEMEDNEG